VKSWQLIAVVGLLLYSDMIDKHLLRYQTYAARKIVSHRLQLISKEPKAVRQELQDKLEPLIGTSNGHY
jgi:hypothetical protein